MDRLGEGNRFDSRKVLNREIEDRVKAHFEGKVFKTLIRENISLAEARLLGKVSLSIGRTATGQRTI